MRVAIASRIFEPEPAAASFRLGALALALADAGHEVTVLTVKPGGAMPADDAGRPYRVKRFPVLRDRTGYVRGYLQYLSFDVPLFFRILFGPKRDAIVVEPPPTTGFFARLAAGLRRTPYFYYGADVWSDAAESAGAPRPVVAVVRAMERFALHGARGVFAVNSGVAERIAAIAPGSRIETVGNGIDTAIFAEEGPRTGAGAFAIYTGTASEWQGAEVFVHATARLAESVDAGEPLRLVFLGQGTAIPALQELALSLDAPVEFHETVPPAEAAAWLRGAAMSVASILPGAGYDFAFPTKVFAAWGTGTPVIYAGPGPVRDSLDANPVLGVGVDHEAAAVADAMAAQLERAHDPMLRDEIARWARANVSLDAVAERAVRYLEASVGRKAA